MNITPQQAKVTAIASKDASRPVLTTMNVTTNGESREVVATDSYRLLSVKTPDNAEASDNLYYAKAVADAAKIAKIAKTDITLPSAVDVGQYPKWQTLKPTENTATAKVNRKLLIELLQAIDAEAVEIQMHPTDRLVLIVITANELEYEFYGY